MNNENDQTTNESPMFPSPLQRDKLIDIGILNPPALMLSYFSIAALLLIVTFLQYNAELRDCFHIESYSDNAQKIFQGIAIISTAIAWWICIESSRRPGKIFPFLWAVFLSLLISTLTFFQFYKDNNSPYAPILDAVTVASIGAVVTLLPRLIRLYPDSPWLQKIAPVSLTVSLIFILPFMLWLAHDITGLQQKYFIKTLESLHQIQPKLSACIGENTQCPDTLFNQAKVLQNKPFQSCWQQSTTEQRKDFTNTQAIILDTLIEESSNRLIQQINQNVEKEIDLNSLDSFNEFKELLQQAKQKKQIENQNIKNSYAKVLKDFSYKLALENDIPLLNDSPVITDVLSDDNGRKPNDFGPWSSNPRFYTKHQQIVAYYQRIHSLFNEIGKLSDVENFPELAIVYAEQQKNWQQQVNIIKESWSHHWLMGYLEDTELKTTWSLKDVLTKPIFDNFSLQSPDDFFKKYFSEIQELAVSSKNCLSQSSVNNNSRGNSMNNFTCLSYINHEGKTKARLHFKFIYNPSNRNVPKSIYLYIPVLSTEKLEDVAYEIGDSLSYMKPAIMKLKNSGYLDYECDDKQCISVNNYLENNNQKYIKITIYPDPNRN